MRKYVIYYTVGYCWNDEGWEYGYPEDDSSCHFDSALEAYKALDECQIKKTGELEKTGEMVTIEMTKHTIPLDEDDEPIYQEEKFEYVEYRTFIRKEDGSVSLKKDD